MTSSLADSRHGSIRATARAAPSARATSPLSSARRARCSRASTRIRSRSSRWPSTHSSYHPGSSEGPVRLASSAPPTSITPTAPAAVRRPSTSTTTSGARPTCVRSATTRPGQRSRVCASARLRLARARASVLSGHSVPATWARERVPVRASRAHRRCSRPPSGTHSPSATSSHPPRRLSSWLLARLVSGMVDHRDLPHPCPAATGAGRRYSPADTHPARHPPLRGVGWSDVPTIGVDVRTGPR